MAKSKKNENSKILAAISYILGVLGIVIYLIAEDDKYARFHALQATILGVIWIVLWIVLLVIGAILTFIPLVGIVIAGLMWLLFSLGILVIVVYLAYRAYTGKGYEIPWIAEQAKKYA